MKKYVGRKNVKNEGITLIALVITIIVILILSGISISMLTGDNGILNQAANAKEITSVAQIKENIQLAVIGALAKEKGATIEEEYLISELDSYFGSDGYTITGNATTDWKITVDSVSRYVNSNGDITEPVTNPYDEDGWTVAYTCTDGVWSDAINAGENAEGDIVAKFYATENTITPPDVVYEGTTYSFSEDTEYYLVIEGEGEMSQLMDADELSAYAWHLESLMCLSGYATTCIMPYVTEITVCEGITNIGAYAFMADVSLDSIKIAHTVTSIDDGAFYIARSEEITIGNSITTIGNYAFYNNQLTSLTLGNNVITIGDHAFEYNQLTNLVIKDSVVTIGLSAFAVNQLSSVVIGNGITTIGNYAFLGNQLTNVTIGSSVTTIGDGAFYSSDYETVYYYKGTISELCNLASNLSWNSTEIISIFGDIFYYNNGVFHCSDGNISWSDLIDS